MSYEDRELRARVRALIDRRAVPDHPLHGRRSSPSFPGLMGATVAVLVVAIVIVAQVRPGEPASSTPAPTAPVSATQAGTAPAPTERLELSSDLTGRLASVSPDARFIGVTARDRTQEVLYRIDRNAATPDRPGLTRLAEVRGQIGLTSWLEDSSVLLVQVDSSAVATGGSKPPRTAFHLVLMSTDGRVAQAPGDAAAFSTRRALLSPDGQWFPIYGECCGSYVRLLRRDGGEVKDVVPSPTDGSGIGFVGWDQNGLLLYQQIWPDHSTLIAVGLDGTQHYSVAAPAELGGVMWNVAVTAADRSWLVVALGKGIGAQPQVYRLLVDGQLRSLPAEVEASKAFGLFNLGNELLYRAGDGSMRAYDVRAGATRTLSLVVARGAASGLIMVGNSDQFFVWMELSRGLIGDLQTGRSVEVTLQSPPTVDRLDGTILAEYRDDSVGIYDLAELTRSR